MPSPICSWSKSLFLFLSVLLIASTSHAQSSIPFEVTPQGHIMIKAKINGVEGNFIFDTGAGMTLLTQNFAAKIKVINKLNRQYTAFRATGEKLAADLFTVDMISVGDIINKNATVTIFDMNVPNVDGLLSLMFFKNHPFTINYKNKTITFENKETLKNAIINTIPIPIALEDSRDISLTMFAYFNIGNYKLQFLIDSGAGTNVFLINSTFIKDLKIDLNDTTKVEKIKHTSEFNPNIFTTFFRTTIPVITASCNPAIKFNSPRVIFIDNLIYDGTTSLNWIGNCITIDLSKRIIFVKHD